MVMGKPTRARPETTHLGGWLAFRCPPEMRKRVEEQARAAGVPMALYVRKAMEKVLGMGKELEFPGLS